MKALERRLRWTSEPNQDSRWKKQAAFYKRSSDVNRGLLVVSQADLTKTLIMIKQRDDRITELEGRGHRRPPYPREGGACEGCGEHGVLKAHGLCQRCYQAWYRERCRDRQLGGMAVKLRQDTPTIEGGGHGHLRVLPLTR